MCASFINDHGLKLVTKTWNRSSLPLFHLHFFWWLYHIACGILIPQPENEHEPEQWKHQDLTARELLPISRKERVWHAHANAGKVSRANDNVLQLTYQEKNTYKVRFHVFYTHTHTCFNMKYIRDNSSIIHQCYSKQCSRKYASNTPGSHLRPSGTF